MVATVEAPSTTGTSTTKNRFVWYDLMSTDKEASLAFFTSLFGWTTVEFDMGEMGTYSVIEAGGASFGGVMSMDPSDWHSSHFIGYIYTDDVDAIAARAPELGGAVPYPPMDIPGIGRFAVLQDVMGAYFSALSTLPTTSHAPETDVPYGCVSWSELSTDDPEKSGAFYAQLFNWELKTSWVAEMPDYTIFMQGESMLGGLWKAEQAGMPSAWLFYFNVEDIDASAAKLAELGGKLVTEIVPVPSVGRIAVAVDPTGATFALMQDES
jgi:predicted enzyme related to lactoylglutathione lyase